MTEWISVLDIAQAWNKAANNEICVQELAKIIAEELERIDAIDEYLNMEKDDIINEFILLSEDETADVDDFDYIMEDLYDWADTSLDNKILNGKKLCWIKTYF